ncbi:MAG TPA: MBL fold metallo-hydrolase [Vicinamibacterales bacterium]|nr:MBL fold metallo-hydrolase [Vicinamibacterales bacterium]
MKRTAILSAIVVCGLVVAVGAAQRDAGAGQGAGRGGGGRGGGGGGGIPPTGMIQHVRDNLYKIGGAGGNTTVFIREDGVVLVDTKLANNGEAILKQVRTVTDKPVTMIINTHQHPDHNGSNDYFKNNGPNYIQVVAHENVKKAMTAVPRPIPATIPDITFSNTLRLGTGKDRIDLYYFGAGHTNGDAFIVFPSVRAMCIGDLMAWNMAPLIDAAAGGSVVALPKTIAAAEKTIKNVDLVIEGHGNVNTWKGMVLYRQFMQALVETAKEGLAKKWMSGRAIDEMKKNPKWAVFLGTERLKDLEYGDTPEHRALINMNVAYQELRGEPSTFTFGPAISIGPEKGSAPAAPARGGGGGGRGAAGRGNGGGGAPGRQ